MPPQRSAPQGRSGASSGEHRSVKNAVSQNETHHRSQVTHVWTVSDETNHALDNSEESLSKSSLSPQSWKRNASPTSQGGTPKPPFDFGDSQKPAFSAFPVPCDTCRSRKLHCDKSQPSCGRCTKSTTECTYLDTTFAASRRESDQAKQKLLFNDAGGRWGVLKPPSSLTAPQSGAGIEGEGVHSYPPRDIQWMELRTPESCHDWRPDTSNMESNPDGPRDATQVAEWKVDKPFLPNEVAAQSVEESPNTYSWAPQRFPEGIKVEEPRQDSFVATVQDPTGSSFAWDQKWTQQPMCRGYGVWSDPMYPYFPRVGNRSWPLIDTVAFDTAPWHTSTCGGLLHDDIYQSMESKFDILPKFWIYPEDVHQSSIWSGADASAVGAPVCDTMGLDHTYGY